MSIKRGGRLPSIFHNPASCFMFCIRLSRVNLATVDHELLTSFEHNHDEVGMLVLMPRMKVGFCFQCA